MKLGNRLQLIASKIPKGLTIIDIGTDHAYLPIYLINKGISQKVIATEINQGPYEKAQENIKKAGLQNFIELRQGSGFKPVKPKEGDIAVVAGMGAATIVDIIKESRHAADSFKSLILQPMRNQAELRKYLYATGYEIIDEDVARDENKFYEVIVARKAHLAHFDEIDIIVGPVLRKKKTPVAMEYLNYRIKVLQNLIEDLKAFNSEAVRRAVLKHEKQLMALREVVK
jgi:tRNA (adenine22-N1)-methyltransferase